MALPILQNTESYVFKYPSIDELTKQQLNIYWTADEIAVEKDTQDLRVTMTEAERHGVITTLKLFVKYELSVGEDYWLGRFRRIFKRPEFRKMAATFGMVEAAIHAPFYNKVNEVLLLNTDEFYTSYLDDPVLAARMEAIGRYATDEDDLVSLAAFSLIEGVTLYSSFSFLKHFQADGKNLLLNTVRGINFSVRDENLHSIGGALAYRLLLNEKIQSGLIDLKGLDELREKIKAVAFEIYHHECQIIDKVFEKGEIRGISASSLRDFVRSRLNLCLSQLQVKEQFRVGVNHIASWFYRDINALQFNDFFSGIGSNYSRDWNEDGFIW